MGSESFWPAAARNCIEVIVIGVSAGGPKALRQIIPQLPTDFDVPILCALHMPPVFTASFAEQLDRNSSIRVLEGKQGQIVSPGCMYLAPGGFHMAVRRNNTGQVVLKLLNSPPFNNCKPSVDVLFLSAAKIYQDGLLTIVLTGMTDDGALGVETIKNRGGYVIVQDKASSLAWGMPGAVVKAGHADEILSLPKIVVRIIELVEMSRKLSTIPGAPLESS